MADPYRLVRGALKAEITARVGGGDVTLSALCAEAGMPSMATLANWRRADPTFDGQLGEALQRGAWRRRWWADPARTEPFLARYRAGETIADILRDPAMPSWKVLTYWRATDGAFAEAMGLVKASRAEERLRGIRAAKTPWAFDEAAADRALVAMLKGARLKDLPGGDRSMPGRTLIARWRREQPDFDAEVRAVFAHRRARHGRAARSCAALTDRIVEAIVQGHSLHSLSHQPGMPCANTLYRWFRERPAFARAVSEACHDREGWYLDQICDLAETATAANQRDVARRMSRLNHQMGRLRHRPGTRRRQG